MRLRCQAFLSPPCFRLPKYLLGVLNISQPIRFVNNFFRLPKKILTFFSIVIY
nr:MAG TPA: hypothetical protein [Caudoviricetes sp.]